MNYQAGCCPHVPNRAEQRRRSVIQTARKLFIENGFHATGMAQLAKDSGVAVGQIYRDFACKEDIVAAIVNADCREFMASGQLHDAIQAGDSQAVREWIRHFIDAEECDEDGALFAEIVAEATRNERIAAIFESLRADFQTKLTKALNMLAPGAAVAEQRLLLADTIMAMSLGLSYFSLLHRPPTIEPLTRKLADLVDREIDALCAAQQG